jgi:hypothetical protein
LNVAFIWRSENRQSTSIHKELLDHKGRGDCEDHHECQHFHLHLGLRPGALSMLDVIEHRFEAALNAVFIRYSPEV